MDNQISFSKIVSTPTLNSWSQAYNAGKLFAVLSLTKNQETQQDLESLNLLGHDYLEKLEQEFFTIEEKNLESIKAGILNTFQNPIEGINISFAASAFISNVLYLFAFGKAKIFIKRDGKFGLVLDESSDTRNIASSSGFLKEADLIVLSTDAFSEVISQDDLNSSLNDSLPTEIAESLAPKIHKAEDGKISAIIIKYGAVLQAEEILDEVVDSGEEIKQEEKKTQGQISPFKKYLFFLKSKSASQVRLAAIWIKKPNIKMRLKRKTFLALTIIIVVILASSIFFTIQSQNNAKIHALFIKTSEDFQKKYDEGQSLLDLNKNLARDSFLSAQKILNDGKDKFPAKSKELAQIQDLLKKADEAVSLSSAINRAQAREVGKDSSNILTTEISNSPPAGGFNFFAQDVNNIYFANNSAIRSKNKEIIKNDNSWKNVGGLGAYLGNIYLLDKDTNQILKFVGSNFTKANYFADSVSPDLSGAKAMTIDGSIWILFADGTIEKFTRGKSDNLTISALDKPFSNPTKIFTNADVNNVYVLDNGNSRIVVIDKNGIYKSQYQSDILKSAKDLEVKEGDRKIFILSQNKIYQIDLK